MLKNKRMVTTMKHYDFIMDESEQRLDIWLSLKLPDLSRSYIHSLIKLNHVLADDKPVKPSVRLGKGHTITVDIPEPEMIDVKPEQIDLSIIYEDEYLLVVDKPQGMVVHPAAGHYNGTLVNALLDYCKGQLSDLNGVIRPGIVHRIDKDTSGLLLVVKNNQIHTRIADQIRRHEVTRTYRAVVHGIVPSDNGTIDAPIGRDSRFRQRMAVTADGRRSVTHFKVLQRFAKATYIEAELETGRTHQIRVHMKYTGHPLLGDPLYASGRPDYGLSGQALHAFRLKFLHPVTDKMIEVESPMPDYFNALLERL
jgi:23S rRNA pseudouridine1911/1915/1917 synthase